MAFTYQDDDKCLESEGMVSESKSYRIADLLEKKRLLTAHVAIEQDQITKIDALLTTARDGGYQDGDDVGQPSSLAALIHIS